jgi:hypothetical protein
VCGFEGFGDLTRDGERFIDRYWTLHDAVRERRTVNQLEHESARVARALQAIDVSDVRMIE